VYEVAAGAQPVVRRDLEPEVREPLNRDQAAVGDAAGEAWPLGTEQPGPHGRVDAVGADEQPGRDPRAVREPQLDAVAVVGESS